MKAKEVLKLLDITRPTLTKYVKTGKILVDAEINGQYIYNDESVHNLLNNTTQDPQIKNSTSKSDLITKDTLQREIIADILNIICQLANMGLLDPASLKMHQHAVELFNKLKELS